jgi:hypothetical protein
VGEKNGRKKEREQSIYGHCYARIDFLRNEQLSQRCHQQSRSFVTFIDAEKTTTAAAEKAENVTTL